jgi:proline racemase
LAVELKWITVREGETILKIDAPCGRIMAYTKVQNARVSGVRFHGVPSFLVGLDRTMEVEGIGKVNYDLAYGGAFYAYVAMKQHNFDFDLSTKSYQELSRNGMHIKHAVIKGNPEIEHPIETDLSFLYGTIYIGDSDTPKIDSKNIYIFAKGEIDRCSTGSGVTGRIAIHSARKEIKPKETMRIESIICSVF